MIAVWPLHAFLLCAVPRSKASGGSRTHISRVARSEQARALGAVDSNINRQATSSKRSDPQFHRHLTLVFKDPEVERSYGEFLRKARVKRLIVVGVLTILLNTMYDMPEWIITLTAPLLRQERQPEPLGSQGQNESSSAASPLQAHGRECAPLALILVLLDVIEVLLQVVLAVSGYLPFLKLHTERAAVIIMLSTSLLSSVRPAAILLFRGPSVSGDNSRREVR